jgi:hypothetical protein
MSHAATVAAATAAGAHIRPGTDKWWILDRGGKIVQVWNDPTARTVVTVLDITSKVNSSCNECGLLGMAFSPDHATTGHFYVSATSCRHTHHCTCSHS